MIAMRKRDRDVELPLDAIGTLATIRNSSSESLEIHVMSSHLQVLKRAEGMHI